MQCEDAVAGAILSYTCSYDLTQNRVAEVTDAVSRFAGANNPSLQRLCAAWDVPVVLDYLSTHFLGEAAQPININTAPQIDFESAVGLLRREAAAVIRYRERNGRFKSIDDLKKIPGVDPRKIEKRRSVLVVL